MMIYCKPTQIQTSIVHRHHQRFYSSITGINSTGTRTVINNNVGGKNDYFSLFSSHFNYQYRYQYRYRILYSTLALHSRWNCTNSIIINIDNTCVTFPRSTPSRIPRRDTSTINSIPGTSIHIVHFTTAASSVTSTNTFSKNSTNGDYKSRLAFLAKFLKLTRIPLLVLSIYKLGYSQGQIDYSTDPDTSHYSMIQALLKGIHCTDIHTQVQVAKEGESRPIIHGNVHSTNSSYYKNNNYHNKSTTSHQTAKTNYVQLQRVAKVAQQIVHSTQHFLKSPEGPLLFQDQQQYIAALKRMGIHVAQQQQEQEHASSTYHILPNKDPWFFYLVDTDVPNAFVTELVPKHIFITTALLNTFVDNDDELALILAHEISHLVLGHVTEQNRSRTMIQTIEILLLTLDPTEGILSIIINSFIALWREAFLASHSRLNETEADHLGIKLAAMACFDTRRASLVFKKMALFDIEGHAAQNAISTTVPSSSSSTNELDTIIIKENDDETSSPTPHQERESPNVDNHQGTIKGANILDSHPPSFQRYINMKNASEFENSERYQDSHCANTRRIFWESFRFHNIFKKQQKHNNVQVST